MARMKTQSEQAVKLDLALRAVADAEGFEVTDDDLDAEYQRVGMQVGEKAAKVTEGVRAERRRRRPQRPDPQVEGARVVDAPHRGRRHGGNPIDNDELLGHSMTSTTTTTTTITTTRHDGAPAVEEDAE